MGQLDPDDAGRGFLPTVTRALQKPYLAAQLGDLYQSASDTDTVRRLTVSGDAPTCRAAIDRLTESGADSIVLQPIHGSEEAQIELVGEQVLRR